MALVKFALVDINSISCDLSSPNIKQNKIVISNTAIVIVPTIASTASNLTMQIETITS